MSGSAYLVLTSKGGTMTQGVHRKLNSSKKAVNLSRSEPSDFLASCTWVRAKPQKLVHNDTICLSCRTVLSLGR